MSSLRFSARAGAADSSEARADFGGAKGYRGRVPGDDQHDDDHDDDHDGAGLEDELDEELGAMADELEDELADAVVEPFQSLPKALVFPALILFAAIAAPLTPDGHSFAQLLYWAFVHNPLEGLIMLLGFGAPFCFGAIVLAAAWLSDTEPQVQELARRVLVANLSLLHAQLLLVAFFMWRNALGMAPLALLGFAAVSGSYFVVRHARAAAEAGTITDAGQLRRNGPKLRWLVRWGATVIVAICGWIRLQLLVGVQLGWAIELMLAACMAMAVLVSRRRA